MDVRLRSHRPFLPPSMEEGLLGRQGRVRLRGHVLPTQVPLHIMLLLLLLSYYYILLLLLFIIIVAFVGEEVIIINNNNNNNNNKKI